MPAPRRSPIQVLTHSSVMEVFVNIVLEMMWDLMVDMIAEVDVTVTVEVGVLVTGWQIIFFVWCLNLYQQLSY